MKSTTHKNADDELVAANLVRTNDLTIGVVNRHAVVESTYSRVYDGQHHCERTLLVKVRAQDNASSETHVVLSLAAAKQLRDQLRAML